MNKSNRDLMEEYFRQYVLEQCGYSTETEELERLFAGVLAFIWSNLYKDPYHPIYFDQIEENPRKWWQFWRER